MADTMMQLAVGRRAAQALGIPVSGAFLLGLIAPDSVRIRPGATRQDYEQTHALEPDWAAAWKAGLTLIEEEKEDAYLLGCAFHILTDSLWVTYRTQVAEGMDPEISEEDRRRMFREETEALERVLYLWEDGHTLFNAILATPLRDDRGYLGLNTMEVDSWRRRCNNVLKNMRHDQPLKILTAAAVETFLTRASSRICREYQRLSLS